MSQKSVFFAPHMALLLSGMRPLLYVLIALSADAGAMSFGVFDPRGQAMGGATVAAASWHQAQYYNPALLALHEEREQDSRDGRFVFPNLVAQADNSAEGVADAVTNELDQQLADAVNAFNSDPTQQTAGEVVSSSRELQTLLDDLANTDITADAFVGFSVSEPSLLEGGAFYFGVRTLAFGSSDIPEDDLRLLDRYIDAVEIVASGGDPATIPADLIDGNGNLIDPTSQFNSTADLSAISISEWAVAMAKQIEVYGQALSFGITPKVMRVDVFRETTNFDDSEFSFSDSQRSYVNLNADLGVALELFDHYRLAFAVKDVVPEEFEASNGLLLQIKPRPRLGLAYVNDWITVGVDVDLAENEPLAAELSTQETSVGLELSPWQSFDLRFGYKQDMTGIRDDVLSGGVAYQTGRFVFELSYARSSLNTGAGMQFGWAF